MRGATRGAEYKLRGRGRGRRNMGFEKKLRYKPQKIKTNLAISYKSKNIR